RIARLLGRVLALVDRVFLADGLAEQLQLAGLGDSGERLELMADVLLVDLHGFLPRKKNPLSAGRREGRSFARLLEAADDGDARQFLARRAAEIVGHADPGILELARAGPTLELQVHLVQHAQARGADRMAETLQPAVDLARDLAVGVVEAVEHVFPALA